MAVGLMERRQHKRWPLACPVYLFSPEGRVLASSHTINVSDSGAYVEVAAGERYTAGPWPERMTLRLAVARSTANTFMLEEFRASASLRRSQSLDGKDGLALAFDQPLPLWLDE